MDIDWSTDFDMFDPIFVDDAFPVYDSVPDRTSDHLRRPFHTEARPVLLSAFATNRT